MYGTGWYAEVLVNAFNFMFYGLLCLQKPIIYKLTACGGEGGVTQTSYLSNWDHFGHFGEKLAKSGLLGRGSSYGRLSPGS